MTPAGLDDGAVDAVVIGAGPAGVQTAACLQKHGRRVVVLERDRVASSWFHFYDSLRLHTHRLLSGLGGFPRRYGRWVARDGVIEHLQSYARTHRLDVRTGVDVTRVDRIDDGWRVSAQDGHSYTGTAVVVATGFNRVPRVPSWPGRERFEGEVLHGWDYRNPDRYRGRRVLVVGTGNTGAEIATELARGGATQVYLSVRSGAHVLPRDVRGAPSQLPGLLLHRLPDRLLDRLFGTAEEAINGDLPDRGLHRPGQGIATDLSTRDVLPVLDIGLAQAVREGIVHPVPAMGGYVANGVRLADGSHLPVDVVIAATGFTTGLAPLVGHLGVLDERELPSRRGGGKAALPGLYFVGFVNSLAGLLYTISREAKAVCRAETARPILRLHRTRSGPRPSTTSRDRYPDGTGR